MELGQVEAFVEANRRGSITRAAGALELTQPTLTARLRGLERELGAQLLVRGRRGVSLTPAGRRFLPRAIAALEALRRGASEARSGSEGRGAILAVGLASDLALYLAPAALARFATRHPQVETLVRSGHSRFIADLLRSEEVELALLSQLVLLPDLASRVLFTEAVPVVVSRTHPLARRASVPIEELAQAGMVVRDPSAYLRAMTLAYFAAGNTAPRILMELDHTEACKRVVLAGLGAALLPEMAIRHELARKELVAVKVEGHPPPRRAIHVLTRAGMDPSAAAAALLRLLPRTA
ncbi:MAG: LysR family transcriptional regulator [Candidatus Limnocylindrales bacterium]